MSEMNVSMKLTLSDLASGPLTQFIDKIKAMDASLKGSTGNLAEVGRLISSLKISTRTVKNVNEFAAGIRSAAATAPLVGSLNKELNALGAAMALVSTNSKGIGSTLTSIGNRAGGASIAVSKLQANMDAMGAVLTATQEKLAATAASFGDLNMEARLAGRGVMLGSKYIDAAGNEMTALSRKTDKASNSLRIMAEAWGALKIAKGLGAAVRSESNIETQKSILRNAGLPENQVNYAVSQSKKMSQQLGYVSENEVLDARRKAIAAIGQNKEIQFDKSLPAILKNAFVVQQNFQPGTKIGDIVGGMAGLAELRGKSTNAQGLVDTSNVALQAISGSQGRLGIGDLETIMRQNKYNPLLNDKSFLWLAAYAEQLKNLGGGGGGGRGVSMAGTGFSMLSKTLMNPKMSKQTAAWYQNMGMFEPGGRSHLGTTTTETISGKQLLGANEGLSYLPGWVEKVLAPHMIAFIKAHPKQFGLSKQPTEEQMANAITKMSIMGYGSTGGVNVASMVIAASAPEKASMIQSHTKLMEQSKVQDQAVANLNKMTAGMARMKAAATNLGNDLGAVLYPAMAKLIEVVDRIVLSIERFVSATPGAAEAITGLATAITALVAIRTTKWIMGLIGLFPKLGAAATTAAAESTAAGVAMQTAWKARLATMGAMFLRFVSWVGLLFLLKEAADNIKIGGITISNHIAALIFGLFSQFDKFFSWLSGKFADAWDWGNKLSNKVTGKTGFWANAARGLGINNYVTPDGKGISNDQVNPFRAAQRSFKGASEDWANAGVDALTPHGGGKNSAYTPSDGPDALKAHEDALNAAAAGVKLPPYSPLGSGKKGKLSAAERTRESLANKKARELDQALNFYQQEMAHDDPIQQLRNKFGPRIATLQAVGLNGLATQLQGQEQKQIGAVQVKQAKKQMDDLQKELDNKIKVTAALIQTGALTQDQGQSQTLKDQKAAAPGLIASAEAVKRYEQAIGKSTTAIDAAIIKFRALGDGLTALQKNIQDTVQGAFQSFFSQIMGGKTSWKDMGKHFVQNLLNGINSSVSKELSSQLVQALFAPSTGAGKALRGFGGSGELMSGIGSWIGNLFGGGTSSTPKAPSTTSSASSGWMSALGSVMSAFISSFAVGADNIPHDMVAQIHKGEMIIPAAGAEAIRSGKLGGGAAPNVNFTIHAMDSQSVLGAMSGIQRELATMLAGTNASLNLGG